MAAKNTSITLNAGQPAVVNISSGQFIELRETAKKFQVTIFHQHNLIALLLQQVLDEHTENAEALTAAIGRLNDDIFLLYQSLDALLFDVASNGGEA